jgi:hypothetical protein
VKNAVSLLGLFALNIFYFWGALTGQRLLVERDLTTFFYPFRFIWVETIRQGQFPFWNPYIKCGVPLFATIQPAVLYPLSLPCLFLPLDLAFNWTIILHFFMAAAFTYVLMLELGATARGALTASLAFLFSGYLISVHNVLNTLLSVAWYPLVILCGCRLVGNGRARWSVAVGLCLCSMFLGGGIEILLFTCASLVFLCLYPQLLPGTNVENGPGLVRRLLLLGLAVLVFLGLSMIQLLPFMELYPMSDRYGGVVLSEATRWSLAPRDLIYFLLPDLFGPRISPWHYWNLQNYLKSIYVGPVCLFLAATYFLRKGRSTLPLLLVMVLSLALALGGHTPIYAVLHRFFPLFATVRYPVKFLFIFIFFLCVAAGFGLDAIHRRFSENLPPASWTQGLILVAAVLLGVALYICRLAPDRVMELTLQWWGDSLDPAFLPTALHNFNRLLVISILGLIIIFFGLRHRLVRLGSPLLLVLLTLDLFLGNRGFAVKLDSSSFHSETEIIRTLKEDPGLFRFHTLPEIGKVEVLLKSYEEFHKKRKQSLGHDLMMEHHLFDIDGYNVPLQRRYENFVNLIRGRPLEPTRPLLNLLNVKYVLANGPIDLPGYVWVRNGLETIKLYENLNYLPRAMVVKDFKVLQGDRQFLQTLKDPRFDPRKTVLLESVPNRLLSLRKEAVKLTLKPEVRVITYENNRMVLEVSTPEAALLFMSESYYPGWKAYVNGRQEEILRANYVFRAIPLGPGSHRVELVCQPLSFKLGMALSLLTIIGLLTAWGISFRRSVRITNPAMRE